MFPGLEFRVEGLGFIGSLISNRLLCKDRGASVFFGLKYIGERL